MCGIRSDEDVARIGKLKRPANLLLALHATLDVRVRCRLDPEDNRLSADLIERVSQTLQMILGHPRWSLECSCDSHDSSDLILY